MPKTRGERHFVGSGANCEPTNSRPEIGPDRIAQKPYDSATAGPIECARSSSASTASRYAATTSRRSKSLESIRQTELVRREGLPRTDSVALVDYSNSENSVCALSFR